MITDPRYISLKGENSINRTKMLSIGNSGENTQFYCHVDDNNTVNGQWVFTATKAAERIAAITCVRSRLIHPIQQSVQERDAPIWVRINRAFFSPFICLSSNVPWNIDGPPFWTLSADLMMAHTINQVLFKHYVCMGDVKRGLEYSFRFILFKLLNFHPSESR